MKITVKYIVPAYVQEIEGEDDVVHCYEFSFVNTDHRRVKREMRKVAKKLGHNPRRLWKQMGFKDLT